jgi:small subunit ribosomal protein S20
VANIKSQQKRVRTNAKATERNRSVKAELRTAVRSTREAVQAGDKDAAETALKTAGVRLDKAASKGVIHKNQAADRKSKLAQQVASI